MGRSHVLVISSCLAIGAATARADEPAEAPAPAPATAPAPTEQLTLPKGKIVIDAFLEINLSSNAVGKPVSLAPDIWYGVTDDLTVGLVHSYVGETGFLGVTGDGLCFTGSSSGCPNFYQDVGADVRYRLAAPWAVDAGLYIDDTSPFVLALKAGVSGRWRFGKAAVEVQPNLVIGLTNRDKGALNELLSIPVTGMYDVTDKIDVAAQTGIQLPFENTGDLFHVPLSLAARYHISPQLSAGLVFTLNDLLGGNKVDTGVDARTIVLGGSYAI
ncbi:MAG TPA: hypothetical protein VLX92_30590 [Kofleriaceae bacterium]|nr:hypothetical protein [Kofleriaceae bacterium]